MSTILYFGNDWNADNRTSSHHIARRLAQRHEVYYVECPGFRAPQGSGRDVKKIWQKVRRSLRGARQVLPGLKVLTLLQVPLHRFAVVRWVNARLILWTIRCVMWRHGIRRPITWFIAPHVASLAGRLGESLTVYYCVDDYASMPNVDVAAVRAMDETLARKRNLVFVTSETLLEKKAALNPNTHYSPHGVDVEHFGRACAPAGSVPEDVRGLRQPIIGFFGLVEQWIDLGLLRYLAEKRPAWTFLMIGRVAVPQDRLPVLPNLHFIGKRSYEELPDYGSRFTATILPFTLTQEAWHANPLKLLEYLAMGKPVVSVAIPAAEKLRRRDRNRPQPRGVPGETRPDRHGGGGPGGRKTAFGARGRGELGHSGRGSAQGGPGDAGAARQVGRRGRCGAHGVMDRARVRVGTRIS